MGIDGLVSVTCHEDIENMNRWKLNVYFRCRRSETRASVAVDTTSTVSA